MIEYIRTKDTVTFINGLQRPVTVSSSRWNFSEIIDLLSSGDREGAFEEAQKAEPLIECPVEKSLVHPNSLHPVLRKILDYGKSINEDYSAFVGRLNLNPERTSVEQAFTFMERYGLPITKDGFILGYKGVTGDNKSVWGNLNSVITEGEVDSMGHVVYKVGERVTQLRSQVVVDPSVGCGVGLHVGSYEYALGWGAKLMLVKVDPKDIVSVPQCCSYQKMRVCSLVPQQFQEGKIETISSEFDGESWVENQDIWDEVNELIFYGQFTNRSIENAYKTLETPVGYGIFENYILSNCEVLPAGNSVKEWIILD